MTTSKTVQIGLSVPEGYGVEYSEAIAIAQAADCEFVEVLFDGRAHPNTVTSQLGPALEDTTLGLVAHLPFTVPVWSPFDSQVSGALETHKACLDAAVSLGAEVAVVHPSSSAMGDAYSEIEIKTGAVDSIQELYEYGAEMGVTVCVENLQSGPFTLDGISHVLSETNASLVIDTGHARVSGHSEDEVVAFFEREQDRIAHIHLNDTRGASDEHLPLGAGTIDFERLFAALGKEWTGRLCVEAVISSRPYLEASLAHLNNLLRNR